MGSGGGLPWRQHTVRVLPVGGAAPPAHPHKHSHSKAALGVPFALPPPCRPATCLPCAGLDIFGTLPASDDSLAAVADACRQAMAIWLAFLAETTDGESAPAVGAPASGAVGRQLQEREGAERQHRDAALRRLLFQDPAMAAAERLFGAAPMQRLLQVATRQPEVLL